MYVGGGGKKERKKKKEKINNVIIKIKFKNQNDILNIIFFFFLNYDFSCEIKTMYQTDFFYNLEFKSGLKFQLQ